MPDRPPRPLGGSGRTEESFHVPASFPACPDRPGRSPGPDRHRRLRRRTRRTRSRRRSQPAGVDIALETVASGLESPVAAARAPGDGHHLFIADQNGMLWGVTVARPRRPARQVARRRPVRAPGRRPGARDPGIPVPYDERGFLGVAFDPGLQAQRPALHLHLRGPDRSARLHHPARRGSRRWPGRGQRVDGRESPREADRRRSRLPPRPDAGGQAAVQPQRR